MEIEHDVGGVKGLLLLKNAFDEATEEKLFSNETIFFPSVNTTGYQFTSEGQHLSGKRCHSIPTLQAPLLPNDVYRICNLVRDTGLYSDLITPDYCLGLTYPGSRSSGGGAEFRMHFDSRYKWGESVVGVTLGQGCSMYFIKAGERVNIELPRRSIYVMTGDARTLWKHGIAKLSAKNTAKFTEPSPSWNPYGMRRSITLRSTKAYSDAVLHRLLERNPLDSSLKERALSQAQFRPKLSDKRLNNRELEDLRANAKIKIFIVDSINTDIRFS